MILLVIYDENNIKTRMDRTYWANVREWKQDPRILVHDIKSRPIPEEALAQCECVLLDPFAIPIQRRIQDEHKPWIERALNCTAKVLLMVIDAHEHTFTGGLTNLCDLAINHSADIICTHRASMDIFTDRGITCFHPPNHIDENIHFNREHVARQYDVVFYGSASPRFYPFRQRIKGILPDAKLRTRIIHRPERNTFDPKRCGEGLAMEINRAWIGICTCSKANYLLGKYLEVVMNGAVVAGLTNFVVGDLSTMALGFVVLSWSDFGSPPFVDGVFVLESFGFVV